MKRLFVFFTIGMTVMMNFYPRAEAFAAVQGEPPLLPEVVVTATRHEEITTSVPAPVVVVTAKEIKESSAANVPELLRTIPGIQVNDISGNRRTYTVDLRGFGETAPTNALVLIDGRRVTQADLSGTDWAQIPLERIERIEIIKGGTGSVLYGDNAAGGVINIITKEGKGLQGGLEASAGSFRTFKTTAYLGGSSGLWSYYLSGGYNRSDGYRDNSKTEGNDFGLNLNYTLKERFKLHLSGGYHDDDTGLPGALKESDFAQGKARRDSIYPNDYAKTTDYYVKASPELSFGDDNLIRLDASHRRRDFTSFASGSWGNFLGDTELTTNDISPHVVFRGERGNIKNTLTLGADFHEATEDIVNESVFFGFPSKNIYKLQKEETGYYLHDEITIGENLVIQGGFRDDHSRFTFSPANPSEVSLSNTAFMAGVNYKFKGKSYIYASYARGFRNPVLDEYFSFITNTVSTTLEPQRSYDYQVGVRYYLGDNFFFHINLFRLETEREIFYNPNTYANENLDGRTKREGIEVSFSGYVLKQLSLRGSYTYLDASIEEGRFAGKEIPGVARNKATLGLTFKPTAALSLSIDSIYVGTRPFISDFDNAFGKQEEYYVINTRIDYQISAARLFLGVNNVTNKKYAEYGVLGGYPLERAYYPSPERNFFVGLSFNF